MAGRNDPRKRKPGKGKAVNPFKAVKEGLGQMGANYRAAGRAITPKSRTPEDVKKGKTSSKTTAKQAPAVAKPKQIKRQTLLEQAHASSGQGGPRRKLKSQQQRMLEGQTKDLQGTGSNKPKPATPAKPKAPAAPNKAKKAAPKAKSKGKSSGSSVKLLSPAEARKVREKKMTDAVAAGRKKRAASGSPPKAMRGKQIRTAAMPRKKKRKGRTSYDELMS